MVGFALENGLEVIGRSFSWKDTALHRGCFHLHNKRVHFMSSLQDVDVGLSDAKAAV